MSAAGASAPRHARWPWLGLGLFVAVAAVGVAGVVINDESLAEQVVFVVAFGLFGVLGALLLSRDRGNRIGALLLYASCSTAIGFTAGELMTILVDRGTTEGALILTTALLSNSLWILGILATLIFLPLLFPDGRLPSPRWRWFAASALVFVVGGFVISILSSRELTGSTQDVAIVNPLFVEGLAFPEGPFFVVYLAFFGVSVASLVVRFRRARDVERQQIRWVAFAVGLLLASFVVSEVLLAFGIENAVVDTLLTGTAFLSLPIAVGVAVLKYRLYDLDVVVRKAVVYASLAVLATLVYLAVVVGAGAWLGRDDPFLTMVAAVVVAVTFQPARERLVHLANRLVYGRRATPYEVLSEFSDRVGETYATDDVLPRMARVIAEATGAERADVWLRIGGELRTTAAWPGNGAPQRAVPLEDGAVPELPDADAAFPVRHRGELLGALSLRKPPADPLRPAEEKLLADLAGHAGLVLRNERLTAELEDRVEQLRALQKRIVSAQDEERRRLERDIHDGAQQQLVAISVKARLARGLTERDPANAAGILEQIEGEIRDALEDLRDLARGIYPPLLADAGLAAALRAQARKAAVPVEVRAGGLGRYPREVEAAVYFSCLEALQNVGKYAGASAAVVTLRERERGLEFEVADDGRGFDPVATTYGTGLQGIADRLAALDGELRVASSPGAGTTVTGTIPVPAGAATR